MVMLETEGGNKRCPVCLVVKKYDGFQCLIPELMILFVCRECFDLIVNTDEDRHHPR